MDPITAFNEYEQAALKALAGAEDNDALEAVRIEFLGKKKAERASALGMGQGPVGTERPTARCSPINSPNAPNDK